MSAPTPVPEIRLNSEHEALVRDHLEELLKSRAFAGSKRAQDFLRLIVEHALRGEVDSLRERMIGAEMFKRPVDYDTANDSVVRVKATEMRKKLTQAYLESDAPTKVRIEVPPGSYVPRFIFDESGPSATAKTNEPPQSNPLTSIHGETANSADPPGRASASGPKKTAGASA